MGNTSNRVHLFYDRAIPFLFRSGASLMGFVLLILFGLSLLIKYPETVVTTIDIIGSNNSKEIIARQTGKISLYATDFQIVANGDALAYINSSSRDFNLIQSRLNEIESNRSLLFDPSFLLIDDVDLGEIQTSYQNLINKREEYMMSSNQSLYAIERKSLNQSLSSQENKLMNVNKRLELMQKKLNTSSVEYENSKVLFEKKAIPEKDLFSYANSYYSSEMALIEVEAERVEILNTIGSIQQKLLSNKIEAERDSIALISGLLQAYSLFQSEIHGWEYEYVISAPCDGRLYYNANWSNDQIIRAGDVFASIVPDDFGEIFCESFVGSERYGDIKVNQDVIIYLDGYEHERYGHVRGTIKDISRVPVIDPNGKYTYKISIALSDRLLTSQNYEIPFSPNLRGTAKIVLEESSLFSKLFYKIKRKVI